MQSLFLKKIFSFISNVISSRFEKPTAAQARSQGGGFGRTPFLGHQPDHLVRKTQAINESLSPHPQGEWEGSNTTHESSTSHS